MKKIIIFVSLIIFLLFATIIFVNAESPNQPTKESIKSKQVPKNEQRGSDQFPMVVKVIPPTINAEEADTDRQERKEKQESDWWLVKLTAVLALIGTIQVIVFGWQARRLRQSVKATEIAAKAAKDSANNIPTTERAYVFATIEKPKLHPVYNKDMGHEGCYCFATRILFMNHGKTPAVITEIHGVISLETAEVSNNLFNLDIPKGIIVGSNKSKRIPITLPISGEEERQKVAMRIKPLYCCGRIEYEDIFHKSHTTGFCWEYRPDGFRRDEPWVMPNKYTALNYYT